MSGNASVERSSLDPRTVQLIHDLRNSLASLRAATHMLSRSPSDHAVVVRAAEGIQCQVTEMIACMDDFVGHDPVPAPAESPAPREEHAASLRVLIADDNVDAANTLATWLRMQGHRTAVAFDGEAAWQLARENNPDVMLLDISMPQLDGYELAKRVREQPWGSHVRLIAVSGWLSPEQRARALAAGYDAQVNKPIDMDALETLLRPAATPCE